MRIFRAVFELIILTTILLPRPTSIITATRCGDFTRQFLDQFSGSDSSSPIFGWISAQGQFPSGPQNQSQLVVRCLAIALSDRDFIIERSCLRALLPSSTEEDGQKRTSNISGADQNNSDFVSDYGDQNDSDLGHTEVVQQGGPMLYSYSSRRSGAELISFSQQQPPRATPLPCIFPLDDISLARLTWNATVCGLQKSDQNATTNLVIPPAKVVCRNVNLTSMYHDADGTLREHLKAESPLFIFGTNGPANLTFLRGIGTLGKSTHFFNKKDCAHLSNRTEGRVHCVPGTSADDEHQTWKSTERSPPSGLLNPAASAWHRYNATVRPYTRQDAQAAALMVPLVLLSVLIASGMLATLITFVCQQKRQAPYSAIE